MSNTQHDYNAMSKVELVKLLVKVTGDNVTNLRKSPKDLLVGIAIKFVRKAQEAQQQSPPGRRTTKATGDSTPVEPKRHYRLTSNGGSTFLQRDQPRKPGEDAKYRVVKGEAMAFVVKSKHQLVLKLAEATRLMGMEVTAVPFAIGS